MDLTTFILLFAAASIGSFPLGVWLNINQQNNNEDETFDYIVRRYQER